MTTFAPDISHSIPDTLEVAGMKLDGFKRLPPAVAFALRQRIVEATQSCGCNWAAGVGSVLLFVYLIVTVLLPMAQGAPTHFSFAWALGAIFTGFVIGKAFGIFRRRRELNDAITELRRLTMAQSVNGAS